MLPLNACTVSYKNSLYNGPLGTKDMGGSAYRLFTCGRYMTIRGIDRNVFACVAVQSPGVAICSSYRLHKHKETHRITEGQRGWKQK